MNERIKELFGQALDQTVPYTWHNLDHVEVEKVIKQFAKLMAWEAIGVCRVDVDALTGPFLTEYEKGIVEGYRRANENLRVYFGVEE